MDDEDCLEASDLGWNPGECAASICHNGEDYLFSLVVKRHSEVAGWKFVSASGKTLMVYND